MQVYHIKCRYIIYLHNYNQCLYVLKHDMLITNHHNNNQPGSTWPCRKAERMDCHWSGNATSEASPCLQLVCAHEITQFYKSNTLQNHMYMYAYCRPWSPSSQSVVQTAHIARHICGKTACKQKGLAKVLMIKLAVCRQKREGFTEGGTLNLERLGTPKGANVAKNSTRKCQFAIQLRCSWIEIQ